MKSILKILLPLVLLAVACFPVAGLAAGQVQKTIDARQDSSLFGADAEPLSAYELMTPGNKKPVEVKRDQDSIVTVLDYLADAAEGLASETGDFLMSALDLVNPLPNDSQTAGTTIASNK